MSGGGGDQNKWLSTGFDPICGEICVPNAPVFASEHSIQTGSQTLFLPPTPHPLLIGCHCQVTKGELNGGVKSTRGHRYMDGKPHSLPRRQLAV